MYFVKAPSLLKKLYPAGLVWQKETERSVYLTFDDGPHPCATPFVLDELEKYQAKATFFCIGKNVQQHADIYARIQECGHRTGNHTHTHLNGWKAGTADYLSNINEAAGIISSNLFRPPYGRIRRAQAAAIQSAGYEIIMWDVLSGDFDLSLSPEQCWEHVARNIQPGSIIVFHDSSKAWERMHYALPRTLALCVERGWKMESL